MFTPEINKKVTEAFQKIIEMKGREIFRRCRGISPYMTDLLPGFEYEAIRGIIKIACDYNIFAILLDESIPNTDARIEYAAEQMTQKTLYQKELTREVVSWAFKALYPSKAINPESILTGDDEAIIDMIKGRCYENGIGVPQSFVEAFKWYKKAADQNLAAAQNQVGLCYFYGWGVSKSIEEARKMFRKAAAQGDPSAKKNLESLMKK